MFVKILLPLVSVNHPEKKLNCLYGSRFVPESARWLIVKGRPCHALRNLQRVAWINGKKEEGEKLTEKVHFKHLYFIC